MVVADPLPMPFGHQWRSSRWFILSCITVALFADTFLFGFVVPILGYMLEDRLGLSPLHTQSLTTALLTIHGFLALLSAPIIAHFVDKAPDKKTPLLISLAGCFVGTLLIACTPSVWALFLGRIVQGLAGSGTWIVGLGTMSDMTGSDSLGQVMGIAMSFVSAGVIAGPMVAGALLELVGYWPAWSVPLGILALDILGRFVMIEPPITKTESAANDSPDETTALIPEPSVDPDVAEPKNQSPHGFYGVILRDARILASILNGFSISALMASFDATIPLHVRAAFNWGSLPAGMIFLYLQLPFLVLGPLAGSLRDKVGGRGPTTAGWAILAPLFVLLGIPGDGRFPWASAESGGKTIYIVCIFGIGVAFCLVRGSGVVQMITVVKDFEAKNPNIFGPSGGTSRMYSLCEIAFSLGLMLGPLACGSLVETVGYFWMNVAMALLCLVNGVSSVLYFEGKTSNTA